MYISYTAGNPLKYQNNKIIRIQKIVKLCLCVYILKNQTLIYDLVFIDCPLLVLVI